MELELGNLTWIVIAFWLIGVIFIWFPVFGVSDRFPWGQRLVVSIISLPLMYFIIHKKYGE